MSWSKMANQTEMVDMNLPVQKVIFNVPFRFPRETMYVNIPIVMLCYSNKEVKEPESGAPFYAEYHRWVQRELVRQGQIYSLPLTFYNTAEQEIIRKKELATSEGFIYLLPAFTSNLVLDEVVKEEYKLGWCKKHGYKRGKIQFIWHRYTDKKFPVTISVVYAVLPSEYVINENIIPVKKYGDIESALHKKQIYGQVVRNFNKKLRNTYTQAGYTN